MTSNSTESARSVLSACSTILAIKDISEGDNWSFRSAKSDVQMKKFSRIPVRPNRHTVYTINKRSFAGSEEHQNSTTQVENEEEGKSSHEVEKEEERKSSEKRSSTEELEGENGSTVESEESSVRIVEPERKKRSVESEGGGIFKNRPSKTKESIQKNETSKSSRTSTQKSKKYDKSSTLKEYSDVLKSIKRKNSSLERLKQKILCQPCSCKRTELEKLYFDEEDQLNEEVVKAIVLQSKHEFLPHSEIPLVANIYEDLQPVQPQSLLNKARKELKSLDENKESEIYPWNDLCDFDEEKIRTYCPDDYLKNLLDKLDTKSTCKLQFMSSKVFGKLNGLILRVMKERRHHIRNCKKCSQLSEKCPKLKAINEDLCLLCKLKLNHLNKGHQDCTCEKVEDPKNLAIDSTNSNSECDNFKEDSPYEVIPCAAKCQCEELDDDSNQEQPVCPIKKNPCCHSNDVLSLCKSMAHGDITKLKHNCVSSNYICKPEECIDVETMAKVAELTAEKEEFRCILREQEAQMEDYRERYLKAKQTVEEQIKKIKKLERCNECIEKVTESEIVKLVKKFEHNLRNFQYRLDLKSEKLKQCMKEKEEIENKLNIVCEELHKMKKSITKETCKLKTDLLEAREKYKAIEKTNCLQKEEIRGLRAELVSLRKETSSIICRAKERVERQITEANDKLHTLEDDLAKERARAGCAIDESDLLSKQMEKILCNYRSSQAKVKMLQLHIKSLTKRPNSCTSSRKKVGGSKSNRKDCLKL